MIDRQDQLEEQDYQAGREVADRLCKEWPTVDGIPDAPSEAWATGAVERLAEVIREQPALLKASREGSERGAESLSPHPFQGILEALQNADDAGARVLRVAVRQGPQPELLIVHDGAPLQLTHVGAMVLPWVTTKAADPSASGRFGIGQKTLRSLGAPIEVHCRPFHFRIEGDGPAACPAANSINRLYRSELRETLLRIPLLAEVDTDALIRFVQSLENRTLLFLRGVRRLSLVDPETGKSVVNHRLFEDTRSEISIPFGQSAEVGERLELRDPRYRRRYLRYLVEAPLAKDERRHHKATGKTTTVGIAIPVSGTEKNSLYDRLPLPIPVGFPFSINAQFDPDTARTALLQRVWNERRLEDLGQLVTAVALDCFARDTASAWRTVPLAREVADEVGEWLAQRMRDHLVSASQGRLVERLQIQARGEPRPIAQIVYEERSLDGLLTPEDQERLKPGCFAIVPAKRDPEGRWRDVLLELDRSILITADCAISLFDLEDDELGERDPRWYIEMAAVAIQAGLLQELLSKRSILLADGRRIQAPEKDTPASLVCRAKPNSLAATLGLALPLHPVYLAKDPSSESVIEELKRADVLLEACDTAADALQVLAREGHANEGGSTPRVRVEDDQLLLLRDAFERLDNPQQQNLGPKIGRNVELRGFEVVDRGRRRKCWVAPAAAYLPASIDREKDNFAKAAATTHGLFWLDPSYTNLLKRTGGRKEIGALRFLSRLGAATMPRLVHPDYEVTLTYDSRPGSPILRGERPELQIEEIRSAGWRDHLLNDRWSPDLETVTSDIQSDRNSQRRRRRAITLLAVLARGWERYYADHEHAKAVYKHYGSWHEPHDVIATWLARLASEPWLPSGTGALRAPVDLARPTEANYLAIGKKKSLYLAKVDDHILHSPLLRALRIRQGPSASSIVERLKELRRGASGKNIAAEVKTAYRLLAPMCGGREGRRQVDDMSLSEFRNAFSGGGRQPGLVFADGRWYGPGQVFVGRAIFGRRRPFLPALPALEPLWRTLEMREPEARDCIAVLRELADGPFDSEEKAVTLETYRTLASKLDTMTPQLRAQLRKLPLWTRNRWTTKRPVYALEDNALAATAAEQVPVWRPGFSSFADLRELLDALHVILLKPSDFSPVSLDGHGEVDNDDLRRHFAAAIGHLRTELARCDQRLHDSIAVPWDQLQAGRVILAENLELAAILPGEKRIMVPADAHMLQDPPTFIVRSRDHAGSAEAGGHAIASLFSGDRQKVAWAWESMWHRAGAGEVVEPIVLSTGADAEEERTGGLIQLKSQVEQRAKGKQKGGATKITAQTGTRLSDTIRLRRLRDLSQLQPDEGKIVNQGIVRRGVEFPPQLAAGRNRLQEQMTSGGGSSSTGSPPEPRRVLPPTNERESLAFEAVQRALRQDSSQIRDLRNRRGIGADAMDEMRQLYEIKMDSRPEIPNEITLTRAEVDAAQNNPDFFLAIVSGLEDGEGQLCVRFLFDPLRRLTQRIKGEVTLTGIREVEALEYRFAKPDDPS